MGYPYPIRMYPYSPRLCLVNLTIINTFIHSHIICMTSTQHVYTNINTCKTTWKHCHVYHVNRGYPRGHMLVAHWSNNTLLRNQPGESKRANGARGRHVTIVKSSSGPTGNGARRRVQRNRLHFWFQIVDACQWNIDIRANCWDIL